MSNGWIKLHRKIIDWEWYKDRNVFSVFLHLLLNANHTDVKWEGIVIKKGQLVTGRYALYDGLNRNPKTGRLNKKSARITIQNIRTALDKLKSTNEITIETTNKYSIITINNWDMYQDTNQESNQQLTNNQPTTNQQLTTNKNVKNDKNVKKENTVPSKDGTSPSNWKPEYGEKYIQAFNKLFNTRCILTKARKRKLQLRFKTFTSEQITIALVNLSKSKFHQGDNDRGWKADPDFLIRSDEQVDKWLNKGGE